MNVRAAVTEGDGTFSIESLTVDAPAAGEVLVAIKASGVCHTDWDSLRWNKRLILGHEGAGIVVSVGQGVTRYSVGDRVMLNWAIPCGTCFQCRLGKENICENRGRRSRPALPLRGWSTERFLRAGNDGHPRHRSRSCGHQTRS